ncbi:hypothetical protein U0X55_01315, partial [Acinetobacter baumannii]|uniref:hypothetical protein n=1 Tax=Acinetobacter baumannii TaxID=470 RepID=UPI0030C31259
SALQAECRRFDPVSAHHNLFQFLIFNVLQFLRLFGFLHFLLFSPLFSGSSPVRCAILLIP